MNTASKIFILCAVIFGLVGLVFAYMAVSAQPPVAKLSYVDAEEKLDSLMAKHRGEATSVADMQDYMESYLREEGIYRETGLFSDSVQHQEKVDEFYSSYAKMLDSVAEQQFTNSWGMADLASLRRLLQSYSGLESVEGRLRAIEAQVQAVGELQSRGFTSLSHSRNTIAEANSLMSNKYIQANETLVHRLQSIPDALYRKHWASVQRQVYALSQYDELSADDWNLLYRSAEAAINELSASGDVYQRRSIDVSTLVDLQNKYYYEAVAYYNNI